MAEKRKVKKTKSLKRYRLRNFILLSLIVHMIVVQLSGYLLKNEKEEKKPIQVKFIQSKEVEKQELKRMQGEIIDLPKPEKIEKPITSNILSKHNSKAHNNKNAIKKNKYKSSKTIAPQKKSSSRQTVKKKSVYEKKVARKIENKRKKKKDEKIVIAKNMVKKDESKETKGTPVALKGLFKGQDKQKNKNKKHQEPLFQGFDPDKFAKLDTGDDEDESDTETVSLDSQELKYASYFLSIKRQIESVWSYPKEAATKGLQGKLMLQFVLDQSGRLVDISLVHSSGHQILDSAALGAVKMASPYNPFPKNIKKKKLRIIAAFKYKPFYTFYK